MRLSDLIQFNWRVVQRQRFRTTMLLIAITISVFSINVLTGIGEGGKQYVLGEFQFLGRDVLIMVPGKKETTGGIPPLTGEAPRELTLRDGEAIKRLPFVNDVAPLIAGNIEITHGSRGRESIVLGTSISFFSVRKIQVAQGKALPSIPLDRSEAVCVLGSELRRELFGSSRALGEWVRAGNRRFRVIGVLRNEGQGLGLDMNELMIIPVASAQTLFNQSGLFRLFIELKTLNRLEQDRNKIIALMTSRHEGEEDITLITQDSMLSAFEGILNTMTFTVAGIAAISMVVAGILIMNVTLISVSQRTREIGLLKALGASSKSVQIIFLSEALLLATIGAVIGIVASNITLHLATRALPTVPFATPLWVQAGSIVVALVTTALFALTPARKAALMAPVDALQNKG